MIAPLVPPELFDPVVAYFNRRRVILFGSTVRGEARADSDIDLLVVLDDDAPPEKLTATAVHEAGRVSRAGRYHPCRASKLYARALSDPSPTLPCGTA